MLPRPFRWHAGPGDPGNVASPHCPVCAVGESTTNVAASGRPFGATGYVPLRPFVANETTPGQETERFTVTLTSPWMPPRPFRYVHVVCDRFTFQPVRVA